MTACCFLRVVPRVSHTLSGVVVAPVTVIVTVTVQGLGVVAVAEDAAATTVQVRQHDNVSMNVTMMKSP